ncbi:MAG: DUF4259 domain-containing protein [Candidatus Hydrogenedentes bacterium]|nr:DUF4259 domain-containing protein [Candidatus Hydrogenedentota bacterium]
MGTWGSGIFENDAAADWAFGLEEAEDLSYVENTLDRVIQAGDEYLEAPDAEEGLAAVEVVARLKGKWGIKSPYSEPVDMWVKKMKFKPSPDLVKKAIAVVNRVVVEPSELLEMWTETDELDEWKDSVAELKSRVSA